MLLLLLLLLLGDAKGLQALVCRCVPLLRGRLQLCKCVQRCLLHCGLLLLLLLAIGKRHMRPPCKAGGHALLRHPCS